MIEVAPRLFVGNQIDYERHVKAKDGQPKDGWAVVHACKEPYHRDAVGYKGLGCPSDSDEYLFARRGNRLCLNMVDAPKPEFFRPAMIDEAMAFIASFMAGSENKVLVHCNQGGSRGPSLALLYLRRSGMMPMSFDKAVQVFTDAYPAYQPAKGIRAYLEQHWG
jgi:hypothetical protein